MYCIVWQYEVKEECVTQFERLYGLEGEWVHLFRKDTNYLGTQLMRSCSEPLLYTTIDQWTNQEVYDQFYTAQQATIDEIDALGDDLTIREVRLGAFVTT